jgi:hypothetical protein
MRAEFGPDVDLNRFTFGYKPSTDDYDPVEETIRNPSLVDRIIKKLSSEGKSLADFLTKTKHH